MAGLFSFAQALAGGGLPETEEELRKRLEQERMDAVESQPSANPNTPAQAAPLDAAPEDAIVIEGLRKRPPADSIVLPKWSDVAGEAPVLDQNAPALRDYRGLLFNAAERQRQAMAQAMGQEYEPREQKNAQFKAHPRLQFGTTGVARDIIGNLTDFVGSLIGRTPTYAREKWQDAIYGWDQPGQFEAAMSRGMQYDPERTATFMEQISQQQHRVGTRENQVAATESANKAREDLANDRKFDNVNKARTALQRHLTAARTPQQRRQIWETFGPYYARNAGVKPEDIGIFPNATDEDLTTFGDSDMTTIQNKTLPIRQQTADASTSRAESARISATKPRAAPAPRAVTNVHTYTDEEGYQVTQRSDGEIIKSPTRVQPTRRAGRRPAAPAAPKRLRFNPATGKIE